MMPMKRMAVAMNSEKNSPVLVINVAGYVANTPALALDEKPGTVRAAAAPSKTSIADWTGIANQYRPSIDTKWKRRMSVPCSSHKQRLLQRMHLEIDLRSRLATFSKDGFGKHT